MALAQRLRLAGMPLVMGQAAPDGSCAAAERSNVVYALAQAGMTDLGRASDIADELCQASRAVRNAVLHRLGQGIYTGVPHMLGDLERLSGAETRQRQRQEQIARQDSLSNRAIRLRCMDSIYRADYPQECARVPQRQAGAPRLPGFIFARAGRTSVTPGQRVSQHFGLPAVDPGQQARVCQGTPEDPWFCPQPTTADEAARIEAIDRELDQTTDAQRIAQLGAERAEVVGRPGRRLERALAEQAAREAEENRRLVQSQRERVRPERRTEYNPYLRDTPFPPRRFM